MPSFEYAGTDAAGAAVRGVALGPDAGAAAATLAARGVSVQEIRPAAAFGDPLAPQAPVPAPREPERVPERFPEVVPDPVIAPRSYVETSVWGPLLGTVPLKDLVFFFRQASVMIRAGVPIVQSLSTLSGQSGSSKLTAILKETREAVEGGYPISAIFQRYPEVFQPIVLSLLRAGEQGGFLDDALTQIADYLDRDLELRNMYKRLTFMPKLQVVAACLIIGGTNLILASLGVAASGRLKNPLMEPRVLVVLVPVTVALFLFFRVGLANGGIRHGWDFVTRLIPGFGKVVQGMAMARWGRAFAAMYKGGVPIPQAMEMAADACGNEEIRARMATAPARMMEGHGIAETLRGTNAFSPIVLDMVATGERTGEMDTMLNAMSDYHEAEAELKAKQLANITGVVVVLIVAIYIGYMVISFWSGYAGGVFEAAEA